MQRRAKFVTEVRKNVGFDVTNFFSCNSSLHQRLLSAASLADIRHKGDHSRLFVERDRAKSYGQRNMPSILVEHIDLDRLLHQFAFQESIPDLKDTRQFSLW